MSLSLVFIEAYGFFKTQKTNFKYFGYFFILPVLMGIVAVISNQILFETLWADSVMLAFSILMISVFLPQKSNKH